MTTQDIRYWLEWKPSIMSESLKDELTKPTKPSFVSSVGSTLGQTCKIAPTPTPSEQRRIDWASGILNDAGVRLIPERVGIPLRNYTPDVRRALRIMNLEDLEVLLLAEGEGEA